jgi:hypothetical protein
LDTAVVALGELAGDGALWSVTNHMINGWVSPRPPVGPATWVGGTSTMPLGVHVIPVSPFGLRQFHEAAVEL